MLTFISVETDDQLIELQKLASEIWLEYWPVLIGQGQTEYMIDMFHSVDVMKNDIDAHGYRFWFLQDENGKMVGYTAGAPEINTGDPEIDSKNSHNPTAQRRWNRRFFISKVYVRAEERGKHYSSKVLSFYEDLCREENYEAMYLTVNVNNTLGIRAYKGNGFEVVDTQKADIGQGFIMDDYIMAKEIR